ncbi:uncharacterized protein N7459_008185 [Penicillium hispanicum]|uniref:uncharacterized protein n=1 Tax=Penicillium hispanicum TaxID=1080232 RepID=UPI0025416EAC|nr:uncharacterized protein N7459_008185 [Penicillium hispanicum]KAJ5573758.1 hypothetical protein N7459_008185 [Penicillium hispanicum]
MAPLLRASLSEADQIRVRTRNIYRHALQAVLDTIYDAQTKHLEPSICEQAGIRRQPLSLEEGCELAPLFFNRYQGALGDTSEPDDPPRNYNATYDHHENVRLIHSFMDDYIHDHHPEGVPGSYISSWDDIKCGGLFESNDFNWVASSVALTVTNPGSWRYRWEEEGGPNPPKPHIKCIMESWVDGDDRLLRGEIIAIIKIMRARLYAKSVRPHFTAPVLLYSTMGPWHIRVLEAYFDGSKLIVRNTPLHDMRGKDAAVLENLTRWWYGHGIGNTEESHADNNLA